MRIILNVTGIREVQERLVRARGRLSGAREVWRRVGQELRAESMRCFQRQESPDGTPWEPLADSTLLSRAYKRTRSAEGRGRQRKILSRTANARILMDTGRLRGSVAVESDERSARIGSALVYARVHQQGDRGGKIPARPYLGLSDEGRERVRAVLERFFVVED